MRHQVVVVRVEVVAEDMEIIITIQAAVVVIVLQLQDLLPCLIISRHPKGQEEQEQQEAMYLACSVYP